MTKLLIGLLGAGVVATGGYAAASSLDADPARTVSLPAATSTDGTTTTGTTAAMTVEDVSGRCDEAEHRNDPRCTGGAAAADLDDHDDDRSGHGSGRDDDDREVEDGHEDRSGSNSGKG